ncbi:uncharacterized protein LOC132726871 [Ruditapes philippinarum]|uniref:uncharacterized protein LOC132726871 n=1 Tax=Ruditapes philippinarum TaxID=129788 RepID=UPI00295B98AD|nr:uncharacterized protein LOC132726871 [Ruditapes philippinarum]
MKAPKQSFISNVTTEDRLDPERFSDWLRLLRVTAWVKRFTDNCRKTNDRNKSRVLTLKELQEVENMFIHKTQVKHYPEEYSCIVKGQPMPRSSKLIPLNVKIDEQDLMRCDTRLTHARFLPYNVRYPIILPRKSPVTRLLVKSFHEAGNHYGTNQTLAAMSSRYWLIGGREEIRDWEKKCSKCKKLKAKVLKQVMAPLPPIRLKKSMRAFANSSVDFAGPFLTKQGRGKVRQKRYLCLFTCLSSRAVHLKIAFGLDTDSFLNAFYRMSSRRGFPEEMYSDNGTNFVGAYNELLELYEQMDKQKITEKANNHRIKWHFNPPLAPHFGGVHESMVKSAKRAIYAVLNSADITDEELLTAITGAEGLINSRPISYQTSHPKDDTVLTPNHFIHGQIGGQFTPEAVDSTVFNVKKRWRYVQEIVKHFWHRWLREFIPTLSNRKKWHQETRDLKVNDVVLVIDADKSRGEWSLGRIVALHPGN